MYLPALKLASLLLLASSTLGQYDYNYDYGLQSRDLYGYHDRLGYRDLYEYEDDEFQGRDLYDFNELEARDELFSLRARHAELEDDIEAYLQARTLASQAKKAGEYIKKKASQLKGKLSSGGRSGGNSGGNPGGGAGGGAGGGSGGGAGGSRPGSAGRISRTSSTLVEGGSSQGSVQEIQPRPQQPVSRFSSFSSHSSNRANRS